MENKDMKEIKMATLERYVALIEACQELINNAVPNGQSAFNKETGFWHGTFTLSGHRIEKIHRLIDHRKCHDKSCSKCAL